jgi:chemotaxis protein methyltransferase CheR
MDKKVFEQFRELIYRKSGISLGPQKVSLVSARIGKRMRALEIGDEKAYLRLVLDDDSGRELVHLIDAISTNVTSFYRESQHFEYLTQVLASWRSAGQSRFRIWCAAASTGEEPYTIAMTASEALAGHRCDLRILATDISTRVLEQCLRGEYPRAKVEPVSAQIRAKYFAKRKEGSEELFTVNAELRRLITFRRLNLSQPPFPMKGPMDVIFIRNVMIYFDDMVRRRLIEEAYRLLRTGGVLMIGHSENLSGCTSRFRVIRPSIYHKY